MEQFAASIIDQQVGWNRRLIRWNVGVPVLTCCSVYINSVEDNAESKLKCLE